MGLICWICGDGWSVGLRPALRGAFRPERKPALQIAAFSPPDDYERGFAGRRCLLSFNR